MTSLDIIYTIITTENECMGTEKTIQLVKCLYNRNETPGLIPNTA